MKEIVARIAILITILLVPGLILWYQYYYFPFQHYGDAKVFNLTAVGYGSGAYTIDQVNGLNYWWKRFSPATIFLEMGDKAVIRLQSADVTHRFYVPELNIEPVDVRPGYPDEIYFTALKTGRFQYFCTTICGPCHFYMTGWIVVTAKGEIAEIPPPINCPMCPGDFDLPPPVNQIELGEYLFLKMGCITCHGIEARGGINNYNYAKGTIPAHNRTADKLFLRSQEDAAIFSEILAFTDHLEELEDPPDIPLSQVVVDRCEALKNIIRIGSRPQKLDKNESEPPHFMPAWKHHLSDREIHGLILYFISLQPWERNQPDTTHEHYYSRKRSNEWKSYSAKADIQDFSIGKAESVFSH